MVPRHSPYTLSSLTIRNSRLTLAGCGLWAFGPGTTVPEPGAWSPKPACDSLHAHCVCVVGKTTVCRIFSCQRSLRGNPSRGISFGDPQDYFPRTPFRSVARGAPNPAPLLRDELVKDARSIVASLGVRAPGASIGQRPMPNKQSGEYRARTGDLLVANQALSQLS